MSTYNPFPTLDSQFSAGMNAIVAALGGSPKVDDIVNAIYAFVQPIFYPTPSGSDEAEIKSVSYNTINSYLNRRIYNLNRETSSI